MKLSIPDMSCGHCKATVEKTIRALDADAAVTVDLTARKAEVTAGATPEAVLAALAGEGYPARIVG